MKKKWEKWKNEKKVLLEDIDEDKQKLSAEIPKIFENIIKKHNEEWEKGKTPDLDFSYFIFPHMDIFKYRFPQKSTNFSKSVFWGNTIFGGSIFKGRANFSYTHFLGKVSFREVQFKRTNFYYTQFEDNANFRYTKFKKVFFVKTIFRKVDFSKIQFEKITFWNTNFEEAELNTLNKNILFSSKNHNKKENWFTIILNKEQEKFFFNLSANELKNIRKKVAMLFQGSALLDSLNVYQNVALPLFEHKSKNLNESQIKQIVQDNLKLVGLENILAKMPSELSGGMKKRVALARAVVLKPKYLIYDEPTTGLDPAISLEIIKLINLPRPI